MWSVVSRRRLKWQDTVPYLCRSIKLRHIVAIWGSGVHVRARAKSKRTNKASAPTAPLFCQCLSRNTCIMHSVSPKRHLVRKKNKQTKKRVFSKCGQQLAECKNKLLSGWWFFHSALRSWTSGKVSFQPFGLVPTAPMSRATKIYICTITSCKNTAVKMRHKDVEVEGESQTDKLV